MSTQRYQDKARWIMGISLARPDAPDRPSCMLMSVSGTVVEGVDGEIRRLREANGKFTGQGRPAVAHCHGRLKAAG